MPFFKEETSEELRSAFVGLVGCGKAKHPTGVLPARLLYTGSLTCMSIKWAQRNCNRWFILSAKYGLLDPEDDVTTYDTKITDLNEEQRYKWGTKVILKLRKLDLHKSTFLGIAGKDYLNCLSRLEVHSLFPDGLKMGQRMAWLKQHPHLTDELQRMILEP